MTKVATIDISTLSDDFLYILGFYPQNLLGGENQNTELENTGCQASDRSTETLARDKCVQSRNSNNTAPISCWVKARKSELVYMGAIGR